MMQRLSIVSALIVALGMVATLSGCSEDEGTTQEGSAAAAQVPESAIVPGEDSVAYATELFAAFDNVAELERFVTSFTEDGWLRAGNVAPEVGHEVLRTNLQQLLANAPTTHVVHSAARNGNRIFVESDVIYRPTGGESVTIPTLILITLNDSGLIEGMFVAMDRSESHPLHGLPEGL